MKKIFAIMALALSSLYTFAADYELSIPSVDVRAGHSAVLSVEIANATDMMAYQFNIDVPTGITLSGLSVDGAITPSAMTQNFDDHGTYYTVQVYGNNKANPIPAGGGVLFNLTVTADASLALGAQTLTIRDIQLTKLVSGTMTTVPASDQLGGDFTINVTANVLDLYDDIDTPFAGTTEEENVVLHRNFAGGKWNTFIVPFDIADPEAVFGSGVQIATFSGISTDFDVDDNPTSITVNFTSATTIDADVPVIVKPASDLTQIAVNSVPAFTPGDFDDLSVQKGSKKTGYSYFQGTYANMKLTPGTESCPLYIIDNKFYYAKSGGTDMKAYRAYFDLYDVMPAALASAPVKMAIDEDPTAITAIDADFENGNAYTIDGKFIGKDVDLKRLQKGVYIVNGKKVINK